MANQQLIQAALQAIQDKEFNAWLLGIGSKGQELIKKLFLETAKKDQKLAAMAKEDPESTMIVFAYQVYKLTKKAKDQNELESTEYETTEPEGEELEEMNYPPVSNPISAKFGAKLKHLTELNGHCPEGYEIQYYSMGGHLCGKCRKKKLMLMLNMACGGKKRIKKGYDGMPLDALQQALQNWQRKQVLKAMQKRLANSTKQLVMKHIGINTPDMYPLSIKDYMLSHPEMFQRVLEYANRPHGEYMKVNNSIKEMAKSLGISPAQYQISTPNYGIEGLKKGGKTLTKAKADSLKYQGGPGDINSTEGMKPNKKLRQMLAKKVKGGMVHNTKKLTIYQQPDMIEHIKY